MSIFAIVLLVASATLHALWNFMLKSAEEKYIAMGWQVILSGVFALNVALFAGLPPKQFLGAAFISMMLEAIYFILLCIAYSDHDFSLVYPIARGAAPAMLVLWSAIFLREQLTIGGYIGLAMITGGIISIGATTLLNNRGEKPHLKGILLALSVALMISLYTFVDGLAVKQTPALPYGLSIFLMIPFVTTPYMVFNTAGGIFSACGTKNAERFCWAAC